MYLDNPASKTQTIGGSTVLPAGPYQPNVMALPQVDLTRDTLPAYNAATLMKTQGVIPAAPRPAPTVVEMPAVANFSASELPALRNGGGMGRQVGEAPPLRTGDIDARDYDMVGQGITPDPHVRPSHLLEMYGTKRGVNVGHLDIVRPERHMGARPTVHTVDEAFGNNPIWEKDRPAILPTPARVNQPRVHVPAARRAEPIMALPVRPAPPRINMPRLPRVTANPVHVEAKPVLPPVDGMELGTVGGGLLQGNKWGPVGVDAGRSFGAEGQKHAF